MPKALPSLADTLFHAAPEGMLPTMSRNLRTSLNFRLREAKRFVLTEQAATKVGEAIASYPEMLVHHGQFAIPPFDNCWIEFPSLGFHNAIVPNSRKRVTEDTDVRVGYLFTGNSVYVGASRSDGEGTFSPFAIDLNRPSSFEQEKDFVERLGVSRLRLDELYWGVSMAKNLDRSMVRSFRAQHSIRLLMEEGLQHALRSKGLADDFIHGCAGEVRNVVGLLLMLNQPKHIRYIGEKPTTRGVTHRGTRTYLGHSVIEVDLNRKPLTVLLGRPQGTHATPRQHDVVGHFAHTGLRALCEHFWQADDDRHWTCANCGGKRWWRAGHKRGDASKGIVTQERKLVYDDA